MKTIFIIANWKSYKTTVEGENWFQEISNFQFPISNEKEIIICPPFTLLPLAKTLIERYNLPISLGAQDISPFDEGAYTGEINGKQIKEFADYVIIGHSERRQNFSETDAMLAKKVVIARKYGLMPIFCVQGKETPVPQTVEIIAYEPVSAIGTGDPDTPENAQEITSIFKQKNIAHTLYGGSVTSENIHAFTSQPAIDGALIGGASLNPKEFLQIVKNV